MTEMVVGCVYVIQQFIARGFSTWDDMCLKGIYQTDVGECDKRQAKCTIGRGR